MLSKDYEGSRRESKRVYGADDSHRPLVQHMGINHRCFHVCVAKQLLHSADVLARLQKVCRETVTKAVRREPDGQPRLSHCLLHRPLDALFEKMMAPDMPASRIS